MQGATFLSPGRQLAAVLLTNTVPAHGLSKNIYDQWEQGEGTNWNKEDPDSSTSFLLQVSFDLCPVISLTIKWRYDFLAFKPHRGIVKTQDPIQRDTWTPVFTATMSRIAKLQR